MPNAERGSFLSEDNPLWYKDAVIYETHVRTFYDSNDDGIGDFKGLTRKLDYLQDLGVTVVWLLPFYPSPLKDDGYDIADYSSVHPAYGTLHDFRVFLQEANRRGLHVVTELVLNHTSDQHRWFQRARQSPPGSPWRDFYVWSDTPDKYREARIIFKDFETSNWAWDRVAKSYYWHRFYSHQPDLNYDRAMVRRTVLRALDFWLRMGVSGLRLDAVPYLYEREGTNCENLPETHAFLKELRKHVDDRFKNRMLLAEANQWPEDAAAYFGQGNESHMAFHFPLMPRMFMSIRMEDRFPIVDILQQTPPIPENCQWALFLRNHDELTLEMVTDEERDYMYRMYARDAASRINLGIRRRLAPLLNNDRKKVELMNGLLFSLPGTPVIYYGDEIGMGDNFYLGDRNGVRTPMQWSANQNAGFSQANPQRLYLPVIIDPEYHYEAINVESQQKNPDSLLWWMKRIIALRKRSKAFGRGSIEFLYPENRKVLAFLRRYQDETILVVANLSRQAQHTSLNLSSLKGNVPVEVFGRSEFPRIGEEPYFITLGPYAFYWFSLEPQRPEAIDIHTTFPEAKVPSLIVTGEWQDLFKEEVRDMLEAVLLGYIRERRWFRGQARLIQSYSIADVIPVSRDGLLAYFVLIRVEYTEGEPEVYSLALSFAAGEEAAEIRNEFPQAVICQLKLREKAGGVEGIVYDALVNKGFCGAVLEAVARRRHFKGENGTVFASPTHALRRIAGPEVSLMPVPLRGEHSNTSVACGDQLVLKLIRRLDEGANPELEIGRFLTEKVPFPHVPPMAGAIEYRRARGDTIMTLGVLTGYVQNEGDAWKFTLDALGHYFERVLSRRDMPLPASNSGKSLLGLTSEQVPPKLEELIGPYLTSIRLLGQRTAELHLALASDRDDPEFAPEPFSLIYQRSMYHAMRTSSVRALQLLRQRLPVLPQPAREDAQRVLNLEGVIIEQFQALVNRKITAMRIRIHGDYHLGQVLYTGKDFIIIDFEGEPARPLGERRLKRSPLRDVAGMIRSFHYASRAALQGQSSTIIRPEDLPILEQWAQLWYSAVSVAFLKAYLEAMGQSSLLPRDSDQMETMFNALLLNKAIYEVQYDLDNRPDWVVVPLQGVLQVLGAGVVGATPETVSPGVPRS